MFQPVTSVAQGVEAISGKTAKELLQRVKSFREQWAKFALHSRNWLNPEWFESFTRDGTPLPKDFLESYRQLDQQKRELVDNIRHRTAVGTPDGWSVPNDDQSLHEFETALESLVAHCRDAERRSAEERERLRNMAQVICGLRNENPQPGNEFEVVRRESQKLFDELSKEGTSISAQHRSRMGAYRSLVRLVNDAMAQRQADESANAASSGSRLSYDELNECFATVSSSFGNSVAFDAMRGCLRPKDDRIEDLRRMSSGQDHAARPDSPITSEQIRSLENNLAGGSAGGSKPPAPHPECFRPEAPPVSLQELATAAERLREKSKRLWPDAMFPFSANDRDPDHVRSIGYHNLALGIELVGEIMSARGDDQTAFRNELHELLRLFAEAQNAVRIEHERRESGSPPLREQETAFEWLRHITGENVERFRIERFMRKDDRADPANNASVADRLHQIHDRWKKLRKREKMFSKIARAAERVAAAKSNQDSSVSTLDQWKSIDKCICELKELGVRPSDTALRDLLLPVIDFTPDDPTDENALEFEPTDAMLEVFEHTQQYLKLSEKSADVKEEAESTADDSTEVVEARGLLSGKDVVIVGGVPKPYAASRLERKLDLNEVRWLPATKQDRVENFAPKIRGAAVVVLVTKVIGHKHNDIRDICRSMNIPCVQMRKSSGYNPNSIAREIMHQVSDQL